MAADDPLTQKALEQIASLEAQASELQSEVVRLKLFVNQGDKLSGRPPRFDNVDVVAQPAPAGQTTAKRWQPGEFFNKPLATVVKTILVARHAQAGGNPSPASLDEIHDALMQGTFNFETSGVEAQKNSIRISLGKNSALFARLPNTDLFGLAEWYGRRTPRKGARVTGNDSTSPASESDDGGEAAEQPAAETTSTKGG
jgi:hypothetical protein